MIEWSDHGTCNADLLREAVAAVEVEEVEVVVGQEKDNEIIGTIAPVMTS